MNNTQITRLLTPSWLVNFIGIATGVLVAAGVIIMTKYQGSELRFQIFDVQSRNIVDQQQGIYANITLEAEKSSFLGTLPLLITWACVGLVVYFFAASITKSLGKAATLKEEMSYVNASSRNLTMQAFISLGIRTVATLGWFLFIQLSINILIPYALAAASAAAIDLSLASIGYALLAIVVIYADIVVHAIFLRLVLLRPRLFGS